MDIPGLPNVKISAREGYFPNEVPGVCRAACPCSGTGIGQEVTIAPMTQINADEESLL